MHWYHNFFLTGPIPGNVMYGEYNLYLVLLSYLIASIASYVALDMSAHLRKPTTPLFRISWLIGGAFVMGAGIWSMHFVGMLAFIMQMPMTYDLYWTGLSMFVAIITAAFAFLFFTTKKPKIKHYLLSGIILGTAIPTMHYTGMAAMNGVHIYYKIEWFLLSIVVAIVAATAALWLAIQSDHGPFIRRILSKLESALIMGFAIVGMHYTGMYGAIFVPTEMVHSVFHADPHLLSIFIAAIVISIMMIAIILSTTRHLLDTTLRNKNEFLEAILNNMRGGVIACDAKGNLTLFNRTVADMYGTMMKTKISLQEWVRKVPFFKGKYGQGLKLEDHPLYRALKGEEVREVEVITKDSKGHNHTLIVEGQPLRGAQNESMGAVIVFNDVSKLKLDEQEIRFRATHDLLTGLPNRVLLLENLTHAIHTAKRHQLKVAVICIGLDNFKLINDTLGHTIGDTLLKMAAARLRPFLRASDTLARIGGDEFVIILLNKENVNTITRFLKRILSNIAEIFEIEGQEINVTCSIGFSIFPENGKDPETLLRNADNALSQAKESGRNTFQVYNIDMYTKLRKRLEVVNGLRHALIHNEFILEYQPKLDIKSNQLVGFEALVRWQHPENGRMPPNEFIPIAEDTGLIVPLGQWILKTVCAQNKAWQEAGLPPVCISVNVSSRQCKEKDFFKTVKDILEETGLPPQFLELELTESIAMEDPQEFIMLLKKFKELGVRMSIDDFGTGYSSLNYLSQFPVHCLKIDRSFIKELDGKGNDLSIVKAIVSLGHSLNLNVIAEGVETKKQLLHLFENDCDEIQGYYLSPPIPVKNVADFVKNYH